jgi:sugar lactone lactonase YvrE
MRTSFLAVLVLLIGCPGGGIITDDDDDTPEPTPEPTPDPCNFANELPAQFEVVPRIVSAEDFVFGLEGEVLSIDPQGTLVSSTKDGEQTVLVPGVVGGVETGGSAGISMLPGGDLVIADVGAGALIRVTPEGGRTTILSGLAYPNGVEVHRDGWVVVAENDGGGVRRVDPDTGEFIMLAEDLFAPNGVTFSPDWSTVYVGSFGGGTVHSITLTEDGSEGAVEFGDIADFVLKGGKAPPWGLDPWSTACKGLDVRDECTLIDQPGTCIDLGGGFLQCEAPDPFTAACEGLNSGDECTLLEETGTCEDFGFDIACNNPDWFGAQEGGGLDGIATDFCGNVYSTEFTTGRIFRWTAEGDGPEVVVTLPSWWIPNMDFGSGIGGWDETKLWVNTRDTDEMYGVDIGLPGRPLAHLPAN